MWLGNILGHSTFPVCNGHGTIICGQNRPIRKSVSFICINVTYMNQEDRKGPSNDSANGSLGEKNEGRWQEESVSVLFQDAQWKTRVYMDFQRNLIHKKCGWTLFLRKSLKISWLFLDSYCKMCALRTYNRELLLQIRNKHHELTFSLSGTRPPPHSLLEREQDKLRTSGATQMGFTACCALIFTETWLSEEILDSIILSTNSHCSDQMSEFGKSRAGW